MPKAKASTNGEPILKELESIKRLMVLYFIKNGITQQDIALALNTDQSEVSRMIPARKLSKKS